MLETIITLALTVLASAAVIYIAYLFSRYVGGRASGGGRGMRPARRINIIDRAAVGQDRYLLITEIKGKYYLIGSSEGGVTLLSELDASEWAGEFKPQPPVTESFKEILSKFKKNKK